MGYILPIRNYEQEQYSIRDITNKQKVYKKEEVNAISKVHNTMENHQLLSEYVHIPTKRVTAKQETHENQTSKDKLVAQLTGKGTHFHASI